MAIRLWVLFFLVVPVQASRIYTYVREDGTKVLTNLGADRGQESESAAALQAEEPSPNFLPLIKKYADSYQIDETLVRAIIQVESNFNPRAVSPKNCKGLMQLHPDTARRFGVRDIFDPEENIAGGVRYLHFLMNYFDRNLDHVLAAYNAGEQVVKRFKGIPPYRETQSYVRRVRALFQPEQGPVLSRRPQEIYRLVREDGRILFTNLPSVLAD